MSDQVSVTGTHTCPTCAHEIVWDWTCHTWRSGTTWVSCLGCDSAVSFRCNNDDYCPWEYTWGLNPGNPRTEANEANRPAWLTGDPEWDRYDVTNMPAGVRSWDEANQ